MALWAIVRCFRARVRIQWDTPMPLGYCTVLRSVSYCSGHFASIHRYIAHWWAWALETKKLMSSLGGVGFALMVIYMQ
jgi:hypothetical protein